MDPMLSRSFEPCYWWRLSFCLAADFEDILFWKLEDLGINRVAAQYSPDDLEKGIFFVWLQENDWPINERKIFYVPLSNLEILLEYQYPILFGIRLQMRIGVRAGSNIGDLIL